MDNEPERDEIVRSLQHERTVDIITTGARSGESRRHEIWITNIAGRIHLCGMPRFKADGTKQPRDWVANLKRHPAFTLCLKASVQVDLPAAARFVSDPEERYAISQAPAMRWYREHSPSLEALLAHSPMFAITFTGRCTWLNDPALYTP